MLIIFWPPIFLVLAKPGRIDVANNSLVYNVSVFLSRTSVFLQRQVCFFKISWKVKWLRMLVWFTWILHRSGLVGMGTSFSGHNFPDKTCIFLVLYCISSQLSCFHSYLVYNGNKIWFQSLQVFMNSLSPNYEAQQVHQRGSPLGLICTSERQLHISAHCWAEPFLQVYLTYGSISGSTVLNYWDILLHVIVHVV